MFRPYLSPSFSDEKTEAEEAWGLLVSTMMVTNRMRSGMNTPNNFKIAIIG